jgi:hypothetical protein
MTGTKCGRLNCVKGSQYHIYLNVMLIWSPFLLAYTSFLWKSNVAITITVYHPGYTLQCARHVSGYTLQCARHVTGYTLQQLRLIWKDCKDEWLKTIFKMFSVVKEVVLKQKRNRARIIFIHVLFISTKKSPGSSWRWSHGSWMILIIFCQQKQKCM